MANLRKLDELYERELKEWAKILEGLGDEDLSRILKRFKGRKEFVDDTLLAHIAEFSPELKKKIFLEFL